MKNPSASVEALRGAGLIPGLERFPSPGWKDAPGGGHVNPLQYSCLESPMDRGAWWPTVCEVAKRWA